MIRQPFNNDWTFSYPISFFEMLAGKGQDSMPVTLPHAFHHLYAPEPGRALTA